MVTNKAKINAIDDTGCTPLHWAVTNQYLDCVEYLLSKNANPNIQDSTGRTPLHIAFQHRFTQIIQLLLDARADLSLRDNFGRLPNEAVDIRNMWPEVNKDC